MAIEFIPKPATRKIEIVDYFFYASVIFLLAAVSVTVIISYANKMANKTIDDLENQLAQEKTSVRQDMEKQVLANQERINDYSQLINAHQFSLKFFKEIENITHPKVWFTDTSLNMKDFKVSLSGRTETLEILGQQIIALEKDQYVKNVNLNKVALNKDGYVEFAIGLVLDPKIFKH